MKDIYFILFILLLNLPFGRWRYRVRKFSFSWILAIHVPVLIIVGSRFIFHVPYQFITLPFSIGAFFLGQFIGGKFMLKKKPDVL